MCWILMGWAGASLILPPDREVMAFLLCISVAAFKNFQMSVLGYVCKLVYLLTMDV